MIVRSRRFSASVGSFCDDGFANLRHIQLIQEVKDDPDFLNPSGTLLFRRVDDNFSTLTCIVVLFTL